MTSGTVIDLALQISGDRRSAGEFHGKRPHSHGPAMMIELSIGLCPFSPVTQENVAQLNAVKVEKD